MAFLGRKAVLQGFNGFMDFEAVVSAEVVVPLVLDRGSALLTDRAGYRRHGVVPPQFGH